MDKLLVIALVLVFLVALSMISVRMRSKSADVSDLSYQELCVKNGNQWMIMEPRRDETGLQTSFQHSSGKNVGGEACAGCMINGNHFCEQDEYLNYIK